jgi:hypothetical protein
MNKQDGPQLTLAFCALSLAPLFAQADTAKEWCYGTPWYNSAFGSRHYHTENGRLVHSSRHITQHQEINPGLGVTCYKRDNPAASYSFGNYANSGWGRSDYIGLGYDFARAQLGTTTYSAGVFIAAFDGYQEFAPKGLGGLAIIPGYTLTAKGEKFGLEAKIVTNALTAKENRRVIFGFSWLMKF